MGGERGMFDVLVRMMDEQGEDILPAEFMSAAERNDLMKNIDRWVISAAMAVCGSRQIQRLFVRLSKDSVRDKSLAAWLNLQLKSTRVDPSLIAFQVTEEVATEYLSETAALGSALRQMGFKYALEHFGAGRDSLRLLTHVPVDYLKVDGTLMQSLAVDTAIQQRVKALVDGARGRSIATIAERVEDANTMAVLWQLGVEYIQGYFVHEPEQVTMGSG
jgi:EAL domain-containing protein (putative c-di-GMP-specific phosphodiesterase class I)